MFTTKEEDLTTALEVVTALSGGGGSVHNVDKTHPDVDENKYLYILLRM